MRYHLLACDYDGTLATNGRVDAATVRALERLLASGRKLVLVTGRELDQLLVSFPEIHFFASVVAENGALLYDPATKAEKVLCKPPPDAFVCTLQARGVAPISVGRVIVATWRPHETTVLDTIRELGLEMQVIFNKDAVMVLPSGVNKATGLSAALAELGFSPHEAVGVGDAENDHAFLGLCECGAAVANALPALKEAADLTLLRDHGAGVSELIDRIVDNDLADLDARLESRRHRRKYAEGELPPERSFYFRGPERKLNLRAQNLLLFMQLADGVDDATWTYHLQQGDYSKWFRECIKDETLANLARALEQQTGLAPAESRSAIRAIIEQFYTARAGPPLPIPGTDAATPLK